MSMLQHFLSSVNPMTNSQKCTLQQSSVIYWDECGWDQCVDASTFGSLLGGCSIHDLL